MNIKQIFIGLILAAGILGRLPNMDITMAHVHYTESCTIKDFQNFVLPGYPLEEHLVITDDGFKLKMFRIQAKGTTIKTGLHPVMLQHGIDGTAANYLFNGEDKSLAYMLANAGYDVWLGNSRGNRFSREHISLKTDQDAFWKWSFQEMAENDIPGAFAKIREITGKNKITYVGHSQGTSQMFAALSDPAISPKIAPYLESFHAFAPVVFLSNTKMWATMLAKYIYWIAQPAFKWLHINHFNLGQCVFDQSLIEKYRTECSQKQCSFDHDTDPIDSTLDYSNYGLVQNTHPSGFASQCVLHFGQLIKEARSESDFKKFDQGSAAANHAKYGQDHPPSYDLTKITSKVFLYLGGQDTIADIKDTTKIAARLSNAQVEVIRQDTYGHEGFIMAKDGKEFYAKVMARIGN